MPINYNTLVKSEQGLHKLFCDYFKHIIDMQNYLLKQIKLGKPLSGLAFRSIESRENKANNFEAVILDETGWVLSKDAPRAAHLRYIIAITRSIKDLERMGDFAFKVAQLFKSEKKLDKRVKNIIARVMEKSCYISERFYKHIADQTKQTRQYYVSVATPLIKEFGEYYNNAFKDLGEIIFKKKKPGPALKAFTALKLLERNADHAYNILESFVYIKEPDFYFKKPEKK